VRDVAYFLCNSLPVETRRAEEKSLLAQYRSGLARHGVTLEEHTVHEQYRLLSARYHSRLRVLMPETSS